MVDKLKNADMRGLYDQYQVGSRSGCYIPQCICGSAKSLVHRCGVSHRGVERPALSECDLNVNGNQWMTRYSPCLIPRLTCHKDDLHLGVTLVLPLIP